MSSTFQKPQNVANSMLHWFSCKHACLKLELRDFRNLNDACPKPLINHKKTTEALQRLFWPVYVLDAQPIFDLWKVQFNTPISILKTSISFSTRKLLKHFRDCFGLRLYWMHQPIFDLWKVQFNTPISILKVSLIWS